MATSNPADGESLPSISRMRPGDHYCGIYRTDEDQRALVVGFVRDGVERGERMLYVIDIQTAAALKQMLAEAGLDAEALVDKGQLVITTAKDAYLREGEFDPERMIELLRTETDRALADGYRALRITGEMTWALAGEPGSDRLLEYEARLNELFPSAQCYAVCQYDRRRFDPEALLDVLHTHPKALVGREAYDNEHMYFLPTEAFLGPDRQSAILDRWLHNLGERRAR